MARATKINHTTAGQSSLLIKEEHLKSFKYQFETCCDRRGVKTYSFTMKERCSSTQTICTNPLMWPKQYSWNWNILGLLLNQWKRKGTLLCMIIDRPAAFYRKLKTRFFTPEMYKKLNSSSVHLTQTELELLLWFVFELSS